MSVPGVADEQRRAIQGAALRAELSPEQLWLRYFSLGGIADPLEVEGFLSGLLPLPGLQCDLLAQAVNERLEEMLAADRAPYSRPLLGRPLHRPLQALVDLLNAAVVASPDQLGDAADSAGRLLGRGAVLYVIDHDQDWLVPVPMLDQTSLREPLAVDGTLAGQVFRSTVTAAVGGEQPRFWVPLRDGAVRVGVLDILLEDAVDLLDVPLREQCEALASALAHLVVSTSVYGDALDALRRRTARTPAAELVWQLLPPTSAATDSFTVAGWILPTDRAGGDSFDYTLSTTTVTLAVFDAMGHGLRAGLIAATALGAYRSARRNGDDLAGQVRALDAAVAAQFGDATFVTGVIAQLDLASGMLQYVCAGHPAPLVLRQGKVVKPLRVSGDVPFGLGRAEVTLEQERLEPGDWLALYTDGITEARDGEGAFFGDDRLIDMLERHAGARVSLPETVRRLTRAVLAHQLGVLQDDATIVLAAWAPLDVEAP
ncbi:MAG: PP2C family protein-serine/threonine phosphatase [Mycobacteriales bacterium]